MTNSENIIEARGLGIHFGGLKALSDVHFNLKRGELRCLIGPNGAGKTTFFRLLTGVHRPSVGSISVAGKSIVGLQTHEIARLGVGIKTQIPTLFDNLSVRENIWLSAKKSKSAHDIERVTDEVIEKIQMLHCANREVGRLSHGQRQSVELGVVVAGKPKVILLDEPAAGMTGKERERTANLITEINKDAAFVVVEHDMEFIKMIAKTVTVFNRGEILMEGTIDQVLADQRVKEVYLGKQAGGVTL